MPKIPKLKKKISSFLTKEDGRISKENLIKTGVLLSAAAMASLKMVKADCPPDSSVGHDDHCNDLTLSYGPPGTATGAHNHAIHSSHSSHGSHNSHNSHASHGSHGSHGQW